jgi:putative FmdB family regulatory protein
MPNYNYECEHCGHECQLEFEAKKAPIETDCPECGLMMDRILSKQTVEIEKDYNTYPSKTERLRNNISETNKKLSGTKDRSLKEGIEKWRSELTGGEY